MLLSHETLNEIAYGILRAGGSEPAEANIVAAHLVRANLSGHDSHGVGMLPAYVEHLQRGLVKPNTSARLVSDSGAVLVFDGEFGYGQRTVAESMSVAMHRARELGVALMAFRNAHHIGRVGDYGEQAAAAGMVSMHFVNVVDHSPFVAPFRGTEARLGTNPICIGIPGGVSAEPIVLDMATSRIAVGKARVAMNSGEQVPEGCLLDASGTPTREPSSLFASPAGALTALGDHKGYGLALACELLAGVLTGGGTIQPGNPRRGGITNHMMTVVLDPGRLVDEHWMLREINATLDYFLASRPAKESEPVLKPGDPERINRDLRMRKGIPMDAVTWGQIREAGGRLGFTVSAE